MRILFSPKFVWVALLLLIAIPSWAADENRLDGPTAMYLYHKLSGEPLDIEALALNSKKYGLARAFDKPSVLESEKARFQSELDQAGSNRVFKFNIFTRAAYQHDKERFEVDIFKPGMFMRYNSGPRNRTEYKLSFANAEGVRYIPMAKDKARPLDAVFRGRGAIAIMEIKVFGAGDPTGAVNSQGTLRGEIISLKYITDRGKPVYDPGPVPPYDTQLDPPVLPHEKFNIMSLRTGMTLDEMKSFIEKEFGKTVSVGPTKRDDPRLQRGIGYDTNGCYTFGKQVAKEGNVCIRAYPDKGGVIRKIVVEQILEGNDFKPIREALLKKYGAMAESANKARVQYYGWGPKVPKSIAGDDLLAPHRKLSASMRGIQSSLERMSASTRVSINLRIRLVDSEWAGSADAAPAPKPKKRKGPRL